MKQIATSFRDGGFDYEIVDRKGDVILAVCIRECGRMSGYIVFHVRKYADRTIMDNFSPAHESVPPAEAFGDEGWEFSGSFQAHAHLNPTDRQKADLQAQLAKATAKFNERFKKQPNSPVIGSEPTGAPRGRARNEFELDLDFTIEKPGCEFGFKDVVAQYPSTDEAMLRNRLKALVLDNLVQIVRTVKIPGQRGKPLNVYRLA